MYALLELAFSPLYDLELHVINDKELTLQNIRTLQSLIQKMIEQLITVHIVRW